MTQARLIAALQPVIEVLAEVDLRDAGKAQAQIRDRLPVDGVVVRKVLEYAEAGLEAGWLLPKENAGVRFGRVSKDLTGFSVDAVLMSSPGPEHMHPAGEVDLCIARSGSPRFDNKPAGWVVYPPGSRHVPTVAGGEMLILYFLPGGAIEWVR